MLGIRRTGYAQAAQDKSFLTKVCNQDERRRTGHLSVWDRALTPILAICEPSVNLSRRWSNETLLSDIEIDGTSEG